MVFLLPIVNFHVNIVMFYLYNKLKLLVFILLSECFMPGKFSKENQEKIELNLEETVLN